MGYPVPARPERSRWGAEGSKQVERSPEAKVDQSSPLLVASVVVLAALVCAVDISIPLGVAGGVPYVAVVLVSLWFRQPRATIWVAIGCSILTVFGLFFSRPGGDQWMVLANRFLSLFAIWATAILGMSWRQAQLEHAQEQQRLAHLSRLGTMGELASGLAHEINQPLSVIANYADAAYIAVRAGKLDPTRILDDLEHISGAAERAGEIVRRMRNFIADRVIDRSPEDINALVLDSLSLMRHEFEQLGIVSGMSLTPELPPVLVDAVQIQQVLVNLLRNAVEAMQGSDQTELDIRSSLNGTGEVEVSISDSGLGLGEMPAESLFEHFVTTKPEGLGIGLAISRSIIEHCGGRLTAEPNPKQGMTFRFTLPVHRGSEPDSGS